MLSLPFSVVLLCLAVFSYLSGLAIYRIFFHPLAKVPGPRLAAVTRWYEFYYDCLVGGGGKYYFKIPEWHQRYGPCIRIGPNEVHIDGQVSPEYYDSLYNFTSKLDKDAWYVYPFGAETAMFATGPASTHRVRRGAVANYFSMASTRGYEDTVLSNIALFHSRLEECRENEQVVNMSDAYRCLSTDVVTSFAIPQTKNMLATSDFGKDFHRIIRSYGQMGAWDRHFKYVFMVMLNIPDWVVEKAGQGGKQLVQYMSNFDQQMRIALQRKGVPPDGEKASILDTLVASPDLPDSDKTEQRLSGEARTIVAAGTETLGHTLSTLTYHVLAQPAVRDRLVAELSTVSPEFKDLARFKTLEPLPYLQACINETLRIANPVSGRMGRINPRGEMSYKSPKGDVYIFEPGTVVSMSQSDMHYNSNVFPEPRVFKPERWLEPTPEMLQCFVPFSRGHRACIGMDLAKMELFMTVGNVFNKFQFELFQTTAFDVTIAHDFFAPFVSADSKGVRVKVS